MSRSGLSALDPHTDPLERKRFRTREAAAMNVDETSHLSTEERSGPTGRFLPRDHVARSCPTGLFARFQRQLDEQAPRQVTMTPDFTVLTDADISAGRHAWSARVVDEHRSVACFSELLMLLAQVQAPAAALVAVQRLIADELRHTQLCRRVARWFGQDGPIEMEAADLTIPGTDDPPAGRALEMVVRELVVAEAESVLAFKAYRDATTDPAVTQVLQILLQDEARHAATGRHLATLLAKTLPAEETASVRARLKETALVDQRYIRNAHRMGATGGAGRAIGASIRRDEIPPLTHSAINEPAASV